MDKRILGNDLAVSEIGLGCNPTLAAARGREAEDVGAGPRCAESG